MSGVSVNIFRIYSISFPVLRAWIIEGNRFVLYFGYFYNVSHTYYSECFVSPRGQLFHYIMAGTWDNGDHDVRYVLDQHAQLDFNGTSSLKQQSESRHVALLGNIILIPSQLVVALTPECCMRKGETSNGIFLCLWFDPTGARTHDLPHSRRARLQLHHRYDILFITC